MSEGRYKVVSVGELTGDEIEIGEVLELNNGIFVFKDGYKTKKTYKTVKEFEEFWEIKIQKIETIKIKNRDFSVLEGLKSVNRWGYKTEIIDCDFCGDIEICLEIQNGKSQDVYINRSNTSDKYTKDNLALNGFEIEFEDVKEINTFKEFGEFLRKERLAFNKDYSSFDCFAIFEKDWGKIKEWKSAGEIEEEYNIKLNILKDK